ncbi:MAG: DUF86 domain-containing protein [Bacteroidetes bacterium]|nr:DUF86 domain-containing protein [Bacteroidota bacterium]
MFSDNNLVFILTMLEAIEKIDIYSRGFDNADDFYYANEQLQFNAVTNLLLVIGEEATKIEVNLKSKFETIAWDKITGLRNRLAHDYRGTDREIVFSVIQNHLPGLKIALIDMISSVSFPSEMLAEALNSEFYTHLQYLRP